MSDRFLEPEKYPADTRLPAAKQEDNSASSLLSIAGEAMWHSAVIDPVRGAGQLFNKATGFNVPLPEARELTQTTTTAGWAAQQIGAGLGMFAPYKLMQTVRPLAFGKELTGTSRALVDGAAFGAVFAPSDDPNASFLHQRFTSSMASMTAFGTQHWLSGMGARSFGLAEASKFTTAAAVGRLGINTLSGGVAGMASAETQAIVGRFDVATSQELKDSAASFMVTGLALEAAGIAGRKARQSRMDSTETPAADRQVAPAETATIISARDQLRTTLNEQLRGLDAGEARQHAATFDSLSARLVERAPQVQPGEIPRTFAAVRELLQAPQLQVELSQPERLSLAKQMLAEAGQPELVAQGPNVTCGPFVIQRLALMTHPGRQMQAIVDVLKTGSHSLAGQPQAAIDLSNQTLGKLDAHNTSGRSYLDTLKPDYQAAQSLAHGAGNPSESGVLPMTRSYASQLAQTINANIKWQALVPEEARAVYVRGGVDPLMGVDTGERRISLAGDRQGLPASHENGAPLIGPGMHTADLQPIYDALTGNKSGQQFVLIKQAEGAAAQSGLPYSSPQRLEQLLLSDRRPVALEVDRYKPPFALPSDLLSDRLPGGHMVMAMPEIDPRTGQVFQRQGQPLFSITDGAGRARGLVGENGLTAREIFDVARQPFQRSPFDFAAEVGAPRAPKASEKAPLVGGSDWQQLGFTDRLSRLSSEQGRIVADLASGTTNQHIMLREMRRSLQRTGLAADGWEIFATEHDSPADKAGHDFWLINKGTGEVHLLDGTWATNERAIALKSSRQGIDLVQMNIADFDENGYRKTNPEAADTARDLDNLLQAVTDRYAMFDLSTSALPDFRRLPPEGSRKELQRFAEWLKERAVEDAEAEKRDNRARDPNDRSSGRILENFYYKMAKDVENRSLAHHERLTNGGSSKIFDTRVARAAESALLDYAIMELARSRGRTVSMTAQTPKLGRDRVFAITGTDASAEDTKFRMILKTTDGAQVQSQPLGLVMQQARIALMRHPAQKLEVAKQRAAQYPESPTHQADLRDAVLFDKIQRRLDAVKRDHNIVISRQQLENYLSQNAPFLDRGGGNQSNYTNPIIGRLREYLQSQTEQSLLSEASKPAVKSKPEPFTSLRNCEAIISKELRGLGLTPESTPEEITLGLDLAGGAEGLTAVDQQSLRELTAAYAATGSDQTTSELREAARRRILDMLNRQD